uniref:Uncharacterized protein n=1 Tax=Acrobeloides nanus TaxID=290746 RepID=A0A914DRD6_9BILA
MEFGEDYSQITYILNGPAIFVVFLVGGILNVVSICILLWKQQRKQSQDELSEVLSISEEKLLDLSSNYGSFCSEASKLDEKKQELSPTLVWITCFEQILLTSTLLNYSIPTLFDLFSSYYAKFIPLWYTISNSSSVAATWLLIISIIFVDYSLASGLRRRLLIIALFSLLISLPRMKKLRGGIIRLFEEGKNANQIATAMNLDRKTVGRIIHRYKKLEVMKTDTEAEGQELLARRLTREKSRVESSEIRIAEKIPHQSIEALKKSLVAAWNKIPQDVIDRAVDDFPKRLQKCIDAQGGHFENK